MSHKKCNWCDKAAVAKTQTDAESQRGAVGASRPAAIATSAWSAPLGSVTNLPRVKSEITVPVQESTVVIDMTLDDIDDRPTSEETQQALQALRENLEIKEEMAKSLKSRSSTTAKSQLESLNNEIASLKLQIGRHKLLRVRIR